MIYLDYQATTPVAPEAAAAMRPWLEEKFANPHSPSTWGREAAAAIEVARGQVVRAIGRDDGRFAFTSGATEALNWALKGTVLRQGRNRIITVATEHAAVLDTCEWLAGQGVDLTVLPVGPDGLIDVAELERELDERVGIVATMLVNNEIGVIQPIAEIARMAHGAGALMICDAVQGFGRMAIPDGPDLIAVSGHKIHGPKGVGGLWMRTGAEPPPLLVATYPRWPNTTGTGKAMSCRSRSGNSSVCMRNSTCHPNGLIRSASARSWSKGNWPLPNLRSTMLQRIPRTPAACSRSSSPAGTS